MKPSNKLTPYPILASFRDDYLNSRFETDIKAGQAFGDLALSVAFRIDEPALEKLIGEGRASYAVHVESPAASYRICRKTNACELSMPIGKDLLLNKVEVCTYVISNEFVKGFRSENFHPDYDSASFDIFPGCILAIGDSKTIEIEDDCDISSRQSVVHIVKAPPAQMDSMLVNTDQSDFILVALRPDLHEVYAHHGEGKNGDLIFSLILLPMLQVVLARMVESREEDEDKEWFKSIEELLLNDGIDPESLSNYADKNSILSVAQRILGQPIERSFETIKRGRGKHEG